MFKKLHLQLTILSTMITGTIVIAMAFLCLYISEHSLYQSQYLDFLNRMATIQTYLQTQTALSTSWLSQTENNGQIILYIEDNGNPIEYGGQEIDPYRNLLIRNARVTAEKTYRLNISDPETSKFVLKHSEFTIKLNNTDYFASVAFIPKSNGALGLIAVYSLKYFHQNLIMQRFIYAGIDLLVIIALSLFSFFFTKRFVKPIEENRKHQAEFVASASHELRSPLAVISSSLSAMKKADPFQSARFENIITSEINRMSRLINDMLSLASADNRSWTIKMENTDIFTLILNAYEAYESIAWGKKIQLSISLPDQPLSLRCDRQRIEQVLSILLDNAVNYTREGGHISLSASQTTQRLEITVADNGIGISDEDKKRVFDRFYRVDSSHKSKEHFGLGLCIAYEIIKLHKGTLTVKDTPGGGASFTIKL